MNELYERMTAAEQSVKSAHKRIDEFSETNRNISEILVEMKYMRRDLNELMQRVVDVETRPVRRYDIIINAFITALIAGVVSFIMK